MNIDFEGQNQRTFSETKVQEIARLFEVVARHYVEKQMSQDSARRRETLCGEADVETVRGGRKTFCDGRNLKHRRTPRDPARHYVEKQMSRQSEVVARHFVMDGTSSIAGLRETPRDIMWRSRCRDSPRWSQDILWWTEPQASQDSARPRETSRDNLRWHLVARHFVFSDNQYSQDFARHFLHIFFGETSRDIISGTWAKKILEILCQIFLK